MKNYIQTLYEQGVNDALLDEVKWFREEYAVSEDVENRLCVPPMTFYGKEVLEMSIAALLAGENILLSGAKATGKNMLAENLAYLFGRPSYNISFHVNTDSGMLIGTDTFVENEVRLRKGPIYQCAVYGGFGILDEINMAKNDAISVLHATLDYRKFIDVPGYDKVSMHPASRFIGTMNYGYAGTKELNEALVSRFLVINMPPLSEEILMQVLLNVWPQAKEEPVRQFCGLFLDMQRKAENGEISTKAMDLRGMIAAMGVMKKGLSPLTAVTMGITNKSFDTFEREMIEDIVMTRIPASWTSEDVF